MLDVLKQLFQQKVMGGARAAAHAAEREQALRVAAVALMLEVVQADFRVTEEERDAMLREASELFGIDEAVARALVGSAESARDEHALSVQPFTRLLNENLDRAAKQRLLEILWRLSYADGHKGADEEAVLRRIADLLYLSPTEFVDARRAAEAERRGDR